VCSHRGLEARLVLADGVSTSCAHQGSPRTGAVLRERCDSRAGVDSWRRAD
jgi:hypothetical protein